MEFNANDLFDGRYILEEQLGRGASATVWRARDQKAGGLVVAVKIFEGAGGIDTYGIQNFAKEFTSVHDLNHTNILKPLSYDIWNSVPYLVMQYCENSSAKNMVGRCDESDIIKFLHDVSSGLEYLHDHEIVHQDIKPDNILLDDNCNFLVTDFGISVASTNEDGAAENTAGTRAYMGPERFNGEPAVKASDIWSLGATAYELLAGQPPFGDNGGMVQSIGEKVPELPDNLHLQPEVKDIIMRCLSEHPWDRPFAKEIRMKTECYLETGKWVRPNGRRTAIIAACIGAVVLLGVAVGLWDYNRVKVSYFKDYAEYWGEPLGIGELSSNEVSHRSSSYRFEKQRGKVRRLSLVNAKGKVVDHSDTEHTISRYPDVYYFYTDKGKIDYATVYNTAGRLLFKMDYEGDFSSVRFCQNDKYSTPLALDAATTKLYRQGSDGFEHKSGIFCFLLNYDPATGLLMERRYVNLMKTPVGDPKIYGQHYEYDEKGRKIEERFLGPDGTVHANDIGLAIKTYSYDENDDWSSVTYLTADREPSHDGNNCPLVKLEYDQYGNRIKERYFTIDDIPSMRTDQGAYGFAYIYDDCGNRLRQINLDAEGNSCYGLYGYVEQWFEYDENGFISNFSYHDENGNLAIQLGDGNMHFAQVSLENNDKGLVEKISWFDELGNPYEVNGAAIQTITYDSVGNELSRKYFDGNDVPVLVEGYYHEQRLEYDEYNRLHRLSYYDIDGNMVPCNEGNSQWVLEYNDRGAVTSIRYLDNNGNLILNTENYAENTYEYDENGNCITQTYLNSEGKPTLVPARVPYAVNRMKYDSKSNFLLSDDYYGTNDKLLLSIKTTRDQHGNATEIRQIESRGNLYPNSAVVHYEYDKNDRVTREFCTNLAGKRVNSPYCSYCEIRYDYDERGNCIQNSYWSVDNKAAVDGQKTHLRKSQYDSMNRVIAEFNYGIDNKPLTGANVNPEGRVKYDKFGNMAEISCFDGYGKPYTSHDGYHRLVYTYNDKQQLIKVEYFDVNGHYTLSKSNEFAIGIYEYDNRSNRLIESLYDVTEKLIVKCVNTYNNRNQLTSCAYYNDKGNLFNYLWNRIARYETKYKDNEIYPEVQRFYDAKGTQVAWRKYDVARNVWGDFQISSSVNPTSASTNASSSHSNWKQVIKEMSDECPYKVNDDVIVESVRYTDSSVTMSFKFLNVNKYDVDSSTVSELRTMVVQVKEQILSPILPSNIRGILIVMDKNGREIMQV